MLRRRPSARQQGESLGPSASAGPPRKLHAAFCASWPKAYLSQYGAGKDAQAAAWRYGATSSYAVGTKNTHRIAGSAMNTLAKLRDRHSVAPSWQGARGQCELFTCCTLSGGTVL